MGAFCCCLCPEDFEEYAYPSNSIYRHCICLRYFFHQLLSGYGATFQRLDGRLGPSQIQTTSSTSSTAGTAIDSSSSEANHLVPRPLPYEADPRYSRPLGLVSRREKSMSHIQEDLHTLRRNGSSSAVEALGAVKKRNMVEPDEGCKLTTESEKNIFSKACNISFAVTSSEDEDVCPTCLEEYTPENPKIVANCSHHFHLGCIYEWMERSDRCPVCGKIFEHKFYLLSSIDKRCKGKFYESEQATRNSISEYISWYHRNKSPLCQIWNDSVLVENGSY